MELDPGDVFGRIAFLRGRQELQQCIFGQLGIGCADVNDLMERYTYGTKGIIFGNIQLHRKAVETV